MRRPEVSAAVALARRQGQALWMVGGALRDLLSDWPVVEIDVAFSGDPAELAKAMESAGFGRSVLLSGETPRVFRVAGNRDLDIAEMTGGSIEADLARRDFTVNAIACALPGCRMIDPFGGIADLARRRLRVVSNRNLLVDPLRVLRAARLMSTHGLTADRHLATLAEQAAAGLAGVAGERIRTEIIKLLAAERAAEPIGWLARVGALGPALGRSTGEWRGMSLARATARLDAPSIRGAAPASRVRLRLFLIANALGHSPSSAVHWLTDRRFGRAEAGEVAALLQLARRALGLKSQREEWEWIWEAGELRLDAARAVALLEPRRPRLARRLARPIPARHVRVGGADLLAWLAVPPGPAVGRLLREVEVEILRGRLRSRREARQWLLKRYGEVLGGKPKGL